jgi:deoxyribodipyrimidine photo-lyase
MKPTLVWFRRDLRVADNQALKFAEERGTPVIPVYVWAPEECGEQCPGAASRLWLHHALEALRVDLRELGLKLVLRKGRTSDVLLTLAEQTGADMVAYGQLFDPVEIQIETKVAQKLRPAGVSLQAFGGQVLAHPDSLKNGSGQPYRVFTPFWRKLSQTLTVSNPTPPPMQAHLPTQWPKSEPLESFSLLSSLPWERQLSSHWSMSCGGGHKRLKEFATQVSNYSVGRDQPWSDGVSRLSPYLHFGQLSLAEIWNALSHLPDADVYLRQLGWREFAHHLLFHFPGTVEHPLSSAFENFPWWSDNDQLLKAWSTGMTGYPLVDAGMRELWATGWMHNRVRMNVGSFLVKHLLGHWRLGARWFWDTLVDANLANNTLGWQWVAGCGADAAPYFRIFNPTTQAKRFDGQGQYIKRWIPELANMPSTFVHAPHSAPSDVLRRAHVAIGENYPAPVVDHSKARERALAGLAAMRATSPT